VYQSHPRSVATPDNPGTSSSEVRGKERREEGGLSYVSMTGAADKVLSADFDSAELGIETIKRAQ